MSAPKITVAMMAAPCAPSACHGVENGHAIRQPALITRPAPAPYRAPAIVGRVASEFRNTQLNNRTRIPPAKVLPIPQPKPMIHGESCRSSLTLGGTQQEGRQVLRRQAAVYPWSKAGYRRLAKALQARYPNVAVSEMLGG